MSSLIWNRSYPRRFAASRKNRDQSRGERGEFGDGLIGCDNRSRDGNRQLPFIGEHFWRHSYLDRSRDNVPSEGLRRARNDLRKPWKWISIRGDEG